LKVSVEFSPGANFRHPASGRDLNRVQKDRGADGGKCKEGRYDAALWQRSLRAAASHGVEHGSNLRKSGWFVPLPV